MILLYQRSTGNNMTPFNFKHVTMVPATSKDVFTNGTGRLADQSSL